MTGETEGSTNEKLKRGRGRGSSFFALAPEAWQQLWTIPTANRLNLLLAYLVLLAGTGSDHQLTKWSAKACDQYLGLGKPRAKVAIDELIASGLVEAYAAVPAFGLTPRYRPYFPADADRDRLWA